MTGWEGWVGFVQELVKLGVVPLNTDAVFEECFGEWFVVFGFWVVDEEEAHGVVDWNVGGFGFGEVISVGFGSGVFNGSGNFGGEVGTGGVCWGDWEGEFLLEVVPVEEVGELAVGAGLLVAGFLGHALDELAAGGPFLLRVNLVLFCNLDFPSDTFLCIPDFRKENKITTVEFKTTSALNLVEEKQSEALGVVEGLVLIVCLFSLLCAKQKKTSTVM